MLKRFKRFIRKYGVLTLASLLIVFGLLIGGLYLFTSQSIGKSSTNAIQSRPFEMNAEPIITGIPVRIQVPSKGIDLKIIPGEYYPKSKSWSLSPNNAQFAKMTNPSNNKQGLTFIYAHARKGVFASLPNIQTGAETVITTDNGHVFRYTYTKNVTTSPDDTSLFTYQGKPLLVLQTCSGYWYQNRQLFLFDLSKVD